MHRSTAYRMVSDMKIISAIVVLLLTYGFLPEKAAAQNSNEMDFICRATISSIFNRDISIIKSVGMKEGIVNTQYVRPDDGSVWSNRCKIEGNRVIWASETGRWRTHAMDELITYSRSGNSLTIKQKFTDGSSVEKSFTIP